jgi:bacterioferritin
MSNSELIEQLNNMLMQEHACQIRYATHAAVVSGPASEEIKERLLEISGDEAEHAKKLRDRIVALGGKPTLKVHEADLKEAYDLASILQINMREETEAITAYTKILETVPQSNVILYRTLQDIIQDEQEHLEELTNLL